MVRPRTPRRELRACLAAGALLLGAAGPAAADAPASEASPRAGAADLSHKGQLQGSVRLGVGLRAITTYDNDVYCGDTDAQGAFGFAPICTGRAPFSLDFEFGFGVARRVDAILEARIGLEGDFGAAPTGGGGPRMLHLSPGARFFFSEGSRSKLFTTAQVVLDLSGYRDATGAKRGTDLGIRNLSGLWFDLSRLYGVYLYVGETASFARWLRFELEGGIGVSARH